MAEYPNLTKEDITNLKKGEVIQYEGEFGLNYLVVDKVNLERGVISGEITEAPGVNGISIEDLVIKGRRVAKWKTD